MITINQVSFSYKKNDLVLHDLNFDLNTPGVYGLFGKNAAGKSTLMKLMSGSLFPTQGSVYIQGTSTEDRSVASLQQVYYLSESIESPNWTAKQLAATYGKLYPNFGMTLFFEILSSFEVKPDITRKNMSMGQQKKLEISFALATQAPYLFMDEATNGLDIPSKKQFRKLINLYISEDQTLILSTHQFREIDQIIDHIMVLDNKQLVLNLSTAKLNQHFICTNQPLTGEQLLYKDAGSPGNYGLYNNPHHRECQLDIELLFTAISTDSQILKNTTIYENEY